MSRLQNGGPVPVPLSSSPEFLGNIGGLASSVMESVGQERFDDCCGCVVRRLAYVQPRGVRILDAHTSSREPTPAALRYWADSGRRHPGPVRALGLG